MINYTSPPGVRVALEPRRDLKSKLWRVVSMSAKVLLISFNLSFIKISAELVVDVKVDNSVVATASCLSIT